MKNLFNSIKLNAPKKNVFDLSHDVKMSCDMGFLVPCCVLEAVPGDKFNIGCQSLVRFAPMLAPTMHRFDITIHYFFVPNRIIWDNWEKWIIDPEAATYVHPTFSLTGAEAGLPLCDYLSIPSFTHTDQLKVSGLPFAAYQAIYHEYYRDQNLVPEFDYKLIDGNNNGRPNFLDIRRRAWEHDYFTSALPFAQKGNAVQLPLGTLNDVRVVSNYDDVAGQQEITFPGQTLPGGQNMVNRIDVNQPNDPNFGSEELLAKTSELEIGSTTINDLRRAFRLQEWLEKNARAGTRYIESILSHFGVRSSDKRLNRPEYITGVKSPVVISEVLNTTGVQTDLSEPQGNMAGHGIGVVSGRHGSYFCEEHGFIMGVMSIMPKPAYMQGVPKHFLKHQDPFQYYWPSFAHIGEQEILNVELYADQAQAARDATFGYTPRYAEYKYQPSRVSGEFRNTLKYWHLSREFATAPGLNKAFIECDPGKRIFAVELQDEDSLYVHVYNQIKAVRPMPKFGTPMF